MSLFLPGEKQKLFSFDEHQCFSLREKSWECRRQYWINWTFLQRKFLMKDYLSARFDLSSNFSNRSSWSFDCFIWHLDDLENEQHWIGIYVKLDIYEHRLRISSNEVCHFLSHFYKQNLNELINDTTRLDWPYPNISFSFSIDVHHLISLPLPHIIASNTLCIHQLYRYRHKYFWANISLSLSFSFRSNKYERKKENILRTKLMMA